MPNEADVLLENPTEMDLQNYPSKYFHPPLTLSSIAELRGVTGGQSRAVDFTAKVLSAEVERPVVVKGQQQCVRDAEIGDDSTTITGKTA